MAAASSIGGNRTAYIVSQQVIEYATADDPATSGKFLYNITTPTPPYAVNEGQMLVSFPYTGAPETIVTVHFVPPPAGQTSSQIQFIPVPTTSTPGTSVSTTSPASTATSTGSTLSSASSITSPTASPITSPATTSSGFTSGSLLQSTKASNSSAQPALTGSPAKHTGTTSTDKGLIAATAVLGVLFLLALIALLFLSRRKRRSGDQRGDYTTAYVPKGIDGSPTSSLENTINTLETQLHERDAQLKASQAALLKKGRSTGGSGLDDRHVNERFSKLSKGINDWVLTHFKNMRSGVSPGRDLAAMLQRSQPNYAALLGDPRAKYLVIRSLVAETLTQAFTTGEFLSNPAFSELNQTVGNTASPVEANEWRALTIPLLEKSSEYRSDRAAVVQEISKKIDFMTSNLAGLGPSDGRLSHLNQVVEMAAILAMDLAKQRALFKVIMDRPGSTTFDATSMEDVLQDHKGEKLQGRPIQSVVFPAVKRWGDDSGNGYDTEHTISKAQVLV